MIRKPFTAVIAALVLTVSALILTASAVAEELPAPPSDDEARYVFHKVDDGFVRLDKQTGEVALCGRQAVGWACLAATEDRAVLDSEIARLRKDNAALKEELLAHGLSLPAGTTEEPPAAGGGGSVTIRLPTSGDFDRMVVYVGQLWHRLVEAIANAQNQVLHRS